MQRVWAFAFVCLMLVGCESREVINVFAASSLTEAMNDIADEYEKLHPGVDVRPVFGGSQVLRLQIEQGAKADVFVSADLSHVEALKAAELLSTTTGLARNSLVVIVPADSTVQSLEELGAESRIVVGSENVPIGRYTKQFLDAVQNGDVLRKRIVSRENNVRLVRAKVELGEADAGIVYATDVNAKVRALPVTSEVSASYAVGLTTNAGANGKAFFEYLTSDGQGILRRHGFESP